MSSAVQAPDTATATLISRQRGLLAILASQDRSDLDEYVSMDIVVQKPDTLTRTITTYTFFNLLANDITLPNGASAEYRATVSGRLGAVTSMMGERCVLTMWRRDTTGWRATQMQLLRTSPPPQFTSPDEPANPLLCHPSANVSAALVRGVSEQ